MDFWDTIRQRKYRKQIESWGAFMRVRVNVNYFKTLNFSPWRWTFGTLSAKINTGNKLRVYVLLWESTRVCARPQVCTRVHSNKNELTGENSCFRHRRLLQRCLHVLKMVQNVSRNAHCLYNMHWQRCRRKFVKCEHHIFKETTFLPVTR